MIALIFSAFLTVSTAHAQSSCLASAANEIQLAQGLKQHQQFLLAAVHFSTAAQLTCKAEEKSLATLEYADCLLHLSESQEAQEILLKFQSSNFLLQKRARLMLARSDAHFRSRLLPEEEARFRIWDVRLDSGQFQSQVQNSTLKQDEKQKLLQIENEMSMQTYKNPWIAGTASALLPGAGQAYNGHWQAAAVAFVLNSLFLASTVELSHKGLNAPALASGLVFSVTYFGNIASAAEGANKINAGLRSPFEKQIELLLFDF